MLGNRCNLFVSCWEDISLVRCAHSFDIFLNTRNKFHLFFCGPVSMLFSQSNCFVCGPVFHDTDLMCSQWSSLWSSKQRIRLNLPISAFYPHFSVLSPFQCFTPISAFYPHFSVLPPFQCFIPISVFYPHFSVLSPFQFPLSVSVSAIQFQCFIPTLVKLLKWSTFYTWFWLHTKRYNYLASKLRSNLGTCFNIWEALGWIPSTASSSWVTVYIKNSRRFWV
jgi:hypothetical protein